MLKEIRQRILDNAKVFVAELASRDDELIVVQEVEELRALDVRINGMMVKALADDGS